jgi:transcription antitermination factor NusG
MRVPNHEGDEVLVTSGPLAGRVGKVLKVDETAHMVTLVVEMFDRETLVDIDGTRLADPDAMDAASAEP